MSSIDLSLISVTYESEQKVVLRVPRGAPGEMVTVRNSVHSCGNYTCLTCISNDCAHARAAREFDRSRGAPTPT